MNSTTALTTLVVLAAYGLRQIASPAEPTSQGSRRFRHLGNSTPLAWRIQAVTGLFWPTNSAVRAR